MIPVLVVNLDRRPDRLAFMDAQLGELGIEWTRVPALDARAASDAEIAREVALSGHRISMGRGGQCCAISHFNIYRQMVADGVEAALVLEDDVCLAREVRPFLEDTSWLPSGVGVVQFEGSSRPKSRRLVGASVGRMPVPGRSLHRLHSRTSGTAGYLITLEAAQLILAEKPLLDVPIDHLLFSPNASPLFHRLGVGIILPSLAVQRKAIASDLSHETAQRKTLADKLRRGWYEINRLPHQLAAMAHGARWQPLGSGPMGSA